MIGWVILAAVLVPALVLGRWAERERRRADAEAHRESAAPMPPVRASGRARGRGGRGGRARIGHARSTRRAPSRSARTYAGR